MSGLKFHRAVLAAAICSALTACGGGGGDDSSAGIGGSGGNNLAGIGGSGGGPGVSSVGTVTGFGSVFVNGVEFFTSDDFIGGDDPSELGETEFEVDGVRQTNDDGLKLGMVVRIQGQLDLDADGNVVETSGRALSIVYDDSIEGPVSELPVYDGVSTFRDFRILSQRVRVEQGSTVFDDSTIGGSGFAFASLSDTDVVEVSGFLDPDGLLIASRIERKGSFSPGGEDGTVVEVKARVSGAPTADRFQLDNGLFVNYSNLVLDDSVTAAGGLADGQFVEVKGVLAETGTAINASDIELEDEGGFDDTTGDDKVSIEGLISELDTLPGTFRINGQLVSYIANTVTYQPTSLNGSLANGLRVEAEGPVVSGTLNAIKIETRSGEIKVEAPLQSIDVENLSFAVSYAGFAISIQVDQQTLLRNDLTQTPITLAEIQADLADGTPPFLKIEAYADGVGGLVATVVELDQTDEHELEAPLHEAPIIDAGGVVTLTLDAGTLVTVSTVVDPIPELATRFEDVAGFEYTSAQAFVDSYLAGDFAIGDRLKISLFNGSNTAEEVEVETGSAPTATTTPTNGGGGSGTDDPATVVDTSGDGQADDSTTP